MRHRKILVFCITAAIFIGTIGLSVPAQASTVLKSGSANGDVWDLQFRLYAMGLFKQTLDGKYGPYTAAVVRNFQHQYGLSVDGVTGNQTWKALKKFSLDSPELNIMAKVIYSEARGEPYKGQVAVGAVVMNRIQSNKFPDNIRDVVFQSGAFSAVTDGQYNLTPDKTAYMAALDAVRGWDPTYNSLYYFNPATATSSWIWSRPQTVKIGNHIFTK